MAAFLRPFLFLSLGFSLLLAPASSDKELIKDTCKFTTVHKDLCAKILSSKKESEKANAHELAKIVLEITHAGASKSAGEISTLHENAEDMSELQQCLEECVRQYEDAMEQLTDANAAMDKKNYQDAAQWVSVAQGDVKLCQLGCKSVPGYKNVVTKQNGEVGRLCSITTSIIKSLVTKN
ncbi:hypothetical protein LUZ60_003534 [Juncus effusus]|nr:hypothetical protein LUZ60_003534 [Juncus effusus]